jgi:hypothetical protein
MGVDTSGGRYDPSEDMWTQTSTSAAPDPRPEPTAVWTGSEMIVWGGGGYGWGVRSTGGAYCATNSCLVFPQACDDGVPCTTDVCTASGSCEHGVSDGDEDGLCDPLDPCPADVQNDADQDGICESADNCPAIANGTQSDRDADGEGDVCDADDGEIFPYWPTRTTIAWQPETGQTRWNVYEGSLDVLRATGIYTQDPGSNPLAFRTCGTTQSATPAQGSPETGAVTFVLVTALAENGTEGTLGTDSEGVERPNANPCVVELDPP